MQQVGKNLHAQRTQYGLKHCMTGTIRWTMGDTLPKIAIEISARDNLFKIWDKGQLVVCDVQIPTCNSGYVYIVVSTKDQTFTYIGMTTSMRIHLKSHNSGRRSTYTMQI
eukprot:6954403-Ditylum_brightwellii.AAC.1